MKCLNLVILVTILPTQCVAGMQVGHGLGKLSPEELQVRLNVRLDKISFKSGFQMKVSEA